MGTQGKDQNKDQHTRWFRRWLQLRAKAMQYFVALPYLLGMHLLQLLPLSFSQRIFVKLADYLATKPSVTSALRDNLSHVLDVPVSQVPQSLVVQSLRSYLRYWLEVFRLPRMDKKFIIDNTKLINFDRLESALAGDQGAILVLPHSGNWDAAGVWLVQSYRSFFTVNERVKPEILYQKFVDYRQSLGFKILAHDDHPFPQLVQSLVSGEIVCLLVDRIVAKPREFGQHIAKKAGKEAKTQVSFFDKPVWVTTGPARLGFTTGAPILAVFPRFTDNGWEIAISQPLSAQEDYAYTMQEIMDFFAENITEKPEDWHAMQRIWNDTNTLLEDRVDSSSPAKVEINDDQVLPTLAGELTVISDANDTPGHRS